MKNRIKSGFTLAELLAVVAIIGVLVAISIPIFTGQLEKSREATDAANIRAQYAQVMTSAITEPGGTINGKDRYGAINLNQKQDNWQNTGMQTSLEGNYHEVVGAPKTGGTAWVEYAEEKVILHYEDGSGNSSDGAVTPESVKQTMAEKAVSYPSEGEYLERGKVYRYMSGDGSTKYYVWRKEERKQVQGRYLQPEEKDNAELVKIDLSKVLSVNDSSEISELTDQVKLGTVIYVESENRYKVWCDTSNATISADNGKLVTLD